MAFFIVSLCTALLLIFGTPVEASAQTIATSFEELRSSFKLPPGQTVRITDTFGRTFKAEVLGVSGNSISFNEGGIRRDLPESSVREIRQRRRDVWWNGMLIGMGVGAAASVITVASECGNDSECAFYGYALTMPLFVGIGAGAGAGIDFAISKYDPVFARPAAASKGFRISPMLSKDVKGAQVSFSF